MSTDKNTPDSNRPDVDPAPNPHSNPSPDATEVIPAATTASGPQVHSFDAPTDSAPAASASADSPPLAESKRARFAGTRALWAEARSTRGGRVATVVASVLAAVVLLGGIGAAAVGFTHGGRGDFGDRTQMGRGGSGPGGQEGWGRDGRGAERGERGGQFGPRMGGEAPGGPTQSAPNGQLPNDPNAPTPSAPTPSGSATSPTSLIAPSSAASPAAYIL